MMKFTSGCSADLPGSSRNKVDKSDQNSEGFHHVPDQCCHFPPKADVFHHDFFKPCHIFPNAAIPFLFHHAFSKPCCIFLNPAIPSLFHHAFAAHFTMIRPTLPFFIKASEENPPITLFGNPFLSASPPLPSIIQGLGLYQRATKFLHNPVIYETKWQSPTSSTTFVIYMIGDKMLWQEPNEGDCRSGRTELNNGKS